MKMTSLPTPEEMIKSCARATCNQIKTAGQFMSNLVCGTSGTLVSQAQRENLILRLCGGLIRHVLVLI
jgi:hypothetical protein